MGSSLEKNLRGKSSRRSKKSMKKRHMLKRHRLKKKRRPSKKWISKIKMTRLKRSKRLLTKLNKRRKPNQMSLLNSKKWIPLNLAPLLKRTLFLSKYLLKMISRQLKPPKTSSSVLLLS